MTQPTPGTDALARAMQAVRKLRERVDELEQHQSEPIAVVGIGCRLPGGADSPSDYWDLLESGTDAVTPLPMSRQNLTPGVEGPPGRAGFLQTVAGFDPYFFGISPREAAQMDPQQRLFLHVAWEALEDAGMTRERVRGSRTGVFVGANGSDYLQLQMSIGEGPGTYTITGTANCMIANRLSYLLDLKGPSMTIDTACSSSLVGVHTACRSLRAMECDATVVGGVNLILSARMAATHAEGLPLAEDGRCRTFDARADGYARGEGVVALVLKRLSTAVADRDRIWAVIRGTAVNQDGLTNGLTAPSGHAQREVVQSALRDARITSSQVTLLEAHGTGTSLGDPIEVEALADVYGKDGTTCSLGSVKTNLGHLEACAGISGLLKAVLSVHHARKAPNLHFDRLNPHIDLDGTRLRVITTGSAWDVPRDQRHAAVSSFGAGGTNAHVIVGPAPEETDAHPDERPEEPAAPREHLLVISGHTRESCRSMAESYRDLLLSEDGLALPFADIAHSAARRRTLHEHRCVVVARDHHEAAERLTSWLSGEEPGHVHSARASDTPQGPLVFVFPGQGSQRAGMGRELLRSCSTFREAVTECDALMKPLLGRSVVDDVIDASDAVLDDIGLVQPALFAVSVGLAARFRSLGFEPDVVVGHSMGEIAAAHVAGALDLEDAVRIICRRSALLRRISGRGAMLVVALPEADAHELIGAYGDRVSVGVVNSTSATVLSGDPEALEEIGERLRLRNVFHKPVRVDVASHSPQTDVLLEELRAELSGIRPRPGKVPIRSTVTGELVDGSAFDADYWARNLREPVRFAEAVLALNSAAPGTFIEMSPHPLLLSSIEETFAAVGGTGIAVAGMRREAETAGVASAVAARLAHGVTNEHDEAWIPEGARFVRPPRYRWRTEPYWFHEGPAPQERTGLTPPAPEPSPKTSAGQADPRTVFDTVLEVVANALGTVPDRIDPRDGFFQMGMDSRMSAGVRTRLQNRLGIAVPAPMLFEHPTVEDLARHLSSNAHADRPEIPIIRAAQDTPQPPDISELSEEALIAELTREVQGLRAPKEGSS